MRLKGKIILRGKGLHSGQECTLKIEPCDAPCIIMNGHPISGFALRGTGRGSDYIYPNGSSVRTCEHVLSALAGLGFWAGVSLTVDGGEMPALDGCSRTMCDALLANSEAGGDAEALNVKEALCVYGEDASRFVAALPYDGFRITYVVEYAFVGSQLFEYRGNYYEDISPARTFAMQSEIDYLRSHGMALGGSLDNAIVIGSTIQAKGGLHWPDEFVRHKVLDIIGDLAAVGQPINAHIIAAKAGHELHLKLAEKLRGA